MAGKKQNSSRTASKSEREMATFLRIKERTNNNMKSTSTTIEIKTQKNSTYLVSVRAPLENKTGADELCMEFPTGGGRKAAAGINALPGDSLERFIQRFSEFYGS